MATMNVEVVKFSPKLYYASKINRAVHTKYSSPFLTISNNLSIKQHYIPMATMNVEVVNKKLIKPSNPTPNHLRHLNLSLFDQLDIHIYVDLIFYYLGNHENSSSCSSTKISQLEKSLSEILNFYYPLAGRFIKNEISIDCGDQGVDFFEARISKKFDQIKDIEIDFINKFLPWDNSPPAEANENSPLLGVQVNIFDCGSIVLGLRISHVMEDASSICHFISEWSTHNRTAGSFDQVIRRPSFSYYEFASRFPARQSLMQAKLTVIPPSNALQTAENGACYFNIKSLVPPLVAKRFLVDETVITRIREESSSILGYKPSRVVVVIALLWKALIRGHLRNSMIAVAMNLRGQLEPLQLQELNYGNFWMLVPITLLASQVIELELLNLINLIGNTIRNAKKKLANANSEEEISNMVINFRREIFEKLRNPDSWDGYIFSSWCNFPVYETDFGWGKPNLVSRASQPWEINWLMDTKNGQGIEAWMYLKKEDLHELEKDQDIQELVS